MPQEPLPNAQAATGDGSTNPPAQAATTPLVTTPPNAQAAEGDNEPLTLEAARKLRSEAASLRSRERAALEKIAVYEAAEAKRQEAELTAQQRAEKALADKTTAYEAKMTALRERAIRAQVESQASRLGIIDPADAMALLDRAAITLDDDGIPTNLDKLLDALVKAKPYLVGKAPTATAGGATNPARSAVGKTGEWTREYVAQLTNDQYNALNATQRASLAQWMLHNAR